MIIVGTGDLSDTLCGCRPHIGHIVSHSLRHIKVEFRRYILGTPPLRICTINTNLNGFSKTSAGSLVRTTIVRMTALFLNSNPLQHKATTAAYYSPVANWYYILLSQIVYDTHVSKPSSTLILYSYLESDCEYLFLLAFIPLTTTMPQCTPILTVAISLATIKLHMAKSCNRLTYNHDKFANLNRTNRRKISSLLVVYLKASLMLFAIPFLIVSVDLVSSYRKRDTDPLASAMF